MFTDHHPDQLPTPYGNESLLIHDLAQSLPRDWAPVADLARPWVEAVRRDPPPFWAMERLLQEFPISSHEGLALMRLAESLLRIPDAETAMLMTADQLAQGQFSRDSSQTPLGKLTAQLMGLSQKFLPAAESTQVQGLWNKLGGQTVLSATLMAVKMLGRQFVLGENIHAAMNAVRSGSMCSFDMLGEGARCEADAKIYAEAYTDAIEQVGQAMNQPQSPFYALPVEKRHGVSIKLSALHPRYEWAQWSVLQRTLIPRFWAMCERAAMANVQLTLDAEEVERLELSLKVFALIAEKVARHYPAWQGLGLAIQAYQLRSLATVHWLAALAKAQRLRLMVRLVKGAYWDSEIKRAQELGLPEYPVWTHKAHTDIAYLACAQALLQHAPHLYPQFASHNATTLAAVIHLARQSQAPFELQRLHGMGEAVHHEIHHTTAIATRIYAPVGAHRHLLAYLVRRLLENGANSSFVHKINDAQIPVDDLLHDPRLSMRNDSALPRPPALYPAPRQNSLGIDLAMSAQRERLQQQLQALTPTPCADTPTADMPKLLATAQGAFDTWQNSDVAARAQMLQQAADLLEGRMAEFCALLVATAHKTWPDSIAEVREAVDFLRYYAIEAKRLMQPMMMSGPTGETNELRLMGRGVWVCISPWNFPLAIFVGQIAAALVTGNAVLAKPAEQTPLIAQQFLALMHEVGVPKNVLQGVYGRGETVGAALVAQPGIAGVVFTGSTAAAQHINRALANKDGAIVPLIAETGGINAMLVDATALPEQVCDAVIQSAFRSAGQRCSALRLLCVHESVAERVIEMIHGACQTLRVGNPADFATDIGPLIDESAYQHACQQLKRLDTTAKKCWGEPPFMQDGRYYLPPQAYEINQVGDVAQEIFAPVLHIVRWSGDAKAVLAAINQLGYGLTLGIHTRMDHLAQRLAQQARVGNIYVNRNMIGAVVGVQPFGGEGLSGTGPKAGGPHYLLRFCREQTLTINTTAAGGNAQLLAQEK